MQAAAKKYLLPARRAIVFRTPVALSAPPSANGGSNAAAVSTGAQGAA
jgi:hypothetical protein